MTLTVVNVAYPFAPVGPDSVGGAEQVLTQIDAALVRERHHSIVIACEGSASAGSLVATPRVEGPIAGPARESAHRTHRTAIERTLADERVDLLHLHGLDFHEYLPRIAGAESGVLTLVTLHLPPGWYSPRVWALCRERPRLFMHCVSSSQREACPRGARLLDDIEGGIPVKQLACRCSKRGFALALGRICPEKNLHAALDAGASAGVPVVLAGRVFGYEAHERYFQDEIVPRLEGGSHRFIGPIGFGRKRRLLGAARCLLIPSTAPETCSLVAMEALACGTPVIAFRVGALPDMIEDGETGFLVSDAAEMALAISMVGQIDPERCRQTARRRFSLERMTGGYVRMYERLAGRGGERASAGWTPGAISGCHAPRSEVLAASSASIAIEAITNERALESLRPEWERLWRDSPDATPFQSPAWLLPWWRWFGDGAPLALACRARDGNGSARRGETSGQDPLVGLVPLYINAAAEPSVRAVMPLGIALSDYLDGVFTRGWGYACADAVLELLARGLSQRAWDAVLLTQLRAGSPLLMAAGETAVGDEPGPGEPCLVLRLPPRAEELSRFIPAGRWRRAQYERRRAVRLGARVERADGRHLDEFIEDLIRLHSCRWQARGLPGALDAAAADMLREAGPPLLAEGLLQLYSLRLEGRAVASVCLLVDAKCAQGDRSVYLYLTGFDPVAASISPGTVLTTHAIEEAVGEGAAWFDFLRGRERYKYDWGAAERQTFARRLRPARCEGGAGPVAGTPALAVERAGWSAG